MGVMSHAALQQPSPSPPPTPASLTTSRRVVSRVRLRHDLAASRPTTAISCRQKEDGMSVVKEMAGAEARGLEEAATRVVYAVASGLAAQMRAKGGRPSVTATASDACAVAVGTAAVPAAMAGVAGGDGGASSEMERARPTRDEPDRTMGAATVGSMAMASNMKEAGLVLGGRRWAWGPARSRYDTSVAARSPSGPAYTWYPPGASSSRCVKSRNTAAEGWWMVEMSVMPVAAMRFSTRITTAAERASRPVVGSSKNSREGLDASSTPTLTRFNSPGDRVPTGRSLSGVSSSTRRMEVTNSPRWCAVMSGSRRRRAEKSMASATVDQGM